jgi:hypothetical protein
MLLVQRIDEGVQHQPVLKQLLPLCCMPAAHKDSPNRFDPAGNVGLWRSPDELDVSDRL